jgi:hypothetical protein
MADPILESSLKTDQIICAVTFFALNKKVDKFQLCLKTAESFPFSFVTFLIKNAKLDGMAAKTKWSN